MPRASISYRQTVLADNPLAYWRLDEAGLTVQDLVSGAQGAVIAGVTRGVVGATADGNAAMTFDGSSGYVRAPVGGWQKGSFSIEFWAKGTTVAGIPDAVGAAPSSGFGPDLAIVVYGDPSASTFGGVRMYYNGTSQLATIPRNVADGRWHHVVYTRQSGGNINSYLDGQLAATQASPADCAIDNTLTFVGAIENAGTPLQFLNGSVDEVAIYKSVLSAQRVMAHYLAGVQSTGFRPAADYEGLVLRDGPVGYWRLDEVTGLAQDRLGLRPGTVGGAPARAVAGVTGDGNAALSMAGLSGTVVLAGPIDFLGRAPFSLECWIKPNQADAAANQRILTCTPNGWKLQQEGSGGRASLRFYRSPIPDVAGTPNDVLAAGLWYHVLCVYDGATQFLYLNGALSGSVVATDSVTANPNPVCFGGDNPGAASFNGTLDEVAIYPYALSAQQAMQHYLTGLRAA